MKTLKRTTEKGVEFRRVADSESKRLVDSDWQFCPKSEWKTGLRDLRKENKPEGKQEKSERKKKKS